ncbi:MAG: cytochrome P450 [Candidatus Binatia bacterium]|nr:cytochrome P450 [Candidatus Binatia bacterium]
MRAPLYSSQADEIFSAEAIEDPHRLYARLRREAPIARVAATGVHLVATRDRIEEVLDREEDFSANLTGVLIRGDEGQPTTLDLPQNAATRVIATADEPSHAVHRAVSQPRMSNSRITELEGPIRSWTCDALGAWMKDGGGDFIPVAELIPARVVAELLGLPDGDVSRHRTWAMMGGDILAGDIGHEQLARLTTESVEMAKYLGEHFENARISPRPEVDAPMLHALARGVQGGKIATDEAVGIATVMFGAGGESTAALIGSVVRRLAEAPEVAESLRGDAKLIPVFVEEVARLEPPFKFHYRAVRRECELGSFSLVPGDRLMLLWASANRDADRVEDPDAFRLDRRFPRDHLTFGRGGHFCIGAGLARLEARIVCEELLARAGHLALSAEAAPVYAKSIFVRRLESLPLAYGA